ncbi:MAG: lycopene beta-cyclase CrtY [Pseudomonadota bacterium]
MNSTSSSPAPLADIAIVGGGLSGGLIAWRLNQLRPDLNVLLVEGGDRLGGNHTWSFHATDLPAAAQEWTAPFITHKWSHQEVRFPAYRRGMETGYRSVTSETFDRLLRGGMGDRVMTGTRAVSITPDRVVLDDQCVIEARAVISATGQEGYDDLALGFQKFAGLELEFAEPHGLTGPIIMDATVPQLDGFRFMYTLPFTPTTALVEDTYYADGAALDRDSIEKRIIDYCASQGWKVARIIRREDGVLPIALGGDIEAHLSRGTDGVGTVGLAAGLFHPLTGYSFPDAVQLADRIAATPDLSGEALTRLVHEHAIETWEDRGFYRMLSRFLFDAAAPPRRYSVMQRFYTLGQPLIERFYAARSTQRDKFRVLAGKPPVGIFKAIKCLDEEKWMARRATI